jgi:type I restriction enzyme, R subunit
VRLRKEGALRYEEQLKRYEELAKQIQPKSNSSNYPEKIATQAQRALYDNLDKNEELSMVLLEEIMNSLPDSWIGNTIKERAVKNIVKKYIQNPKKADSIFEIIKNQNEYK